MIKSIKKILKKIYHFLLCKRYPNITKSSFVYPSTKIYNRKNLYMDECTSMDANTVIMNTRANVIMKKWSGSAIGLTIITGNHMQICGKFWKQVTNDVKDKLDVNHIYDKDVIINEDVLISSNVTILSGVHIGRGAIIGSGAVCVKDLPPYSVCGGVPAKVIKFKWTIDEILKHEEQLYKQEERFSRQQLEKIFKDNNIKNNI